MPGFRSKARNLESLEGVVKKASIPISIIITRGLWERDRDGCIERIVEKVGEGPLIVRSSAVEEDTNNASNAGAFESIGNVARAELESAIDTVFSSYTTDSLDSEIFVQQYLKDVYMSGVAFSHDPNTCSPYRTINWHEGEDTTVVTAGRGGRVWQSAAMNPCPVPSRFKQILELLDELLKIYDQCPLDIEFAFTNSNSCSFLWLLQVRPLILSQEPETPEVQFRRLTSIETKIAKASRPHPFLKGNKAIFGVMPDWNPAEIIGIRPRPLALSLYKDLITDSIWAYQRHNYGYRNLRGFPLMLHYNGLPYIDVRTSFNSFIPSELDDELANRLVDYYTDRLLDEPELHDKIEFEIVHSCYTFDMEERLSNLKNCGFSDSDLQGIKHSLRRLTNKVIDPVKGLWKVDARKLEILKTRRELLMQSTSDPLERIYWLLEDGKRYGTLPFAGLARAGFIAVQMLRSLVNCGILSTHDYDLFMHGVNSISSQLTRDQATLDKTSFISRYGHLRPGTYDIMSSRYDETPELYFDWEVAKQTATKDSEELFSLTIRQMSEMVNMLERNQLAYSPFDLLTFIKSGIELREEAKFFFTKNLSDALNSVVAIGREYGFTRDDLSYSNINVFYELFKSSVDPRSAISRSIDSGKEEYLETLHTCLPTIISSPKDVWSFEWADTIPNFITQKQILAMVGHIDELEDINNKIVCIPSADPGYDWLFSHGIKGLITAWGGANSHMAIRAGELGIPAVIGSGELLFNKWSKASKILIDCASKKVEVIA